jgi:hypothetical protein
MTKKEVLGSKASHWVTMILLWGLAFYGIYLVFKWSR